jgi:hypothetical protein
MNKWTTPTLEMTVPKGLDFDWLLVTFEQLNYKIEKIVDASAVVDNKFYVTFSQEETGQFKTNSKVEVQVNIMNGTERQATLPDELVVTKNLHDAYIDPSTPSILEITENGEYDVSKYSKIIVNVGG